MLPPDEMGAIWLTKPWFGADLAQTGPLADVSA